MNITEAQHNGHLPHEPDFSLTDPEVIGRIALGEVHQFEVIVRRHNQRLYRIARSILPDDQLALDALQNGYIKAYGALSSVKKPERLGAWLNTVVRNEALMLRRRRSKERPLDADAENNLTAEEAWMGIPSPAPDSIVLTTELRELLETHIDGMTGDLREVLILRAVEGMSTREVSELLNLEENTVRTRYYRARHFLQESLGGSFKDLYTFDGERCDRVVHNVLKAIGVPHTNGDGAAT